MGEEATPVVIDIGTGFIRGGIAGDESPQFAMLTNVYRQNSSHLGKTEFNKGTSIDCDNDIVNCGDTCSYLTNMFSSNANELTMDGTEIRNGRIRHPLRRCIIYRWDDIELLLQYSEKNKLRFSFEEHPILLSEPPMNSKYNRELMTQLSFEQLGVPAMYISVTGALALYGSGKTSGLVVECGEGSSFTVPIVDGYVVNHGCQRIPFAGRDMTAYLLDLYSLRNKMESQNSYSIPDNILEFRKQTSASHCEWRNSVCGPKCDLEWSLENERTFLTMQIAKEKLCVCGESRSVNRSADDKLALAKTESRTLPDGQIIELNNLERYEIAELLFEPEVILSDFNLYGLQYHVIESIMKCEAESHRELFSSLVFAGGTTCIDNFSERLINEVSHLIPSSTFNMRSGSSASTTSTSSSCDRSIVTWFGGSILSSLTTFQQLWITKDEYDESGPTVSHRKCF